MRIRSLSDAVYTGIAWFPLLAVLVFVLWTLTVGTMHFEHRTWGSEFFVQNEGSINHNDVSGWRDARQDVGYAVAP